MTLAFKVQAGSGEPIYRQISAQVRRAVITGTLKQGDTMPSVRVLAELLVVNPNTVARSYADLCREGVLESQPGRGVFVAEQRSVLSQEERARRFSLATDKFLDDVMHLGFSRTEIRKKLDAKIKEWDSTGEIKHE